MLNWLHFSDLHFGLEGQRGLWPDIRAAFFADLPQLHQKSGPWDVVLFTGDLVQTGAKDEYRELEDQVLGPIWEKFAKLQDVPALLTVPGNHDLVRPKSGSRRASVQRLLDHQKEPGKFSLIKKDVLAGQSQYRQDLARAFQNYEAWWNANPRKNGLIIKRGLLPGDFSTTIKAGDKAIGIVGLNTTFMQLAGGDYLGKLELNREQLLEVCDNDPPGWVAKHEVCLLLTHQGRNWLSPRGQAELAEMSPPGRFALHLFGHDHTPTVESFDWGGGTPRKLWQGAALFGLDKFGDFPQIQIDRRHGYSAGRLSFKPRRAFVQIWPRKATFDGNSQWRVIPDNDRFILDQNGSITPQPIGAHGHPAYDDGRNEVRDLVVAQQEFSDHVKELSSNETAIIRHLGLDMQIAGQRLGAMIVEDFHVKNAEVELLVIGSDPNSLPERLAPAARRWAGKSRPAVDNLIGTLMSDLINERFSKRRQSLKLTIKNYYEQPMIHGFSLKSTTRGHIATYFSNCRWVKKESGWDIDYGPRGYRCVLGNEHDETSEDLLAIFNGLFERLWEQGVPYRDFVIPSDNRESANDNS